MNNNIQLNFLLNTNYDLSIEEQKIISALSKMLQPNDENFKYYTFKSDELIKLLEIENIQELLKLTKELMRKILELRHENKIIQTSWINSVTFNEITNSIELSIHPFLKPYLLKLKENNVLVMKCKYSPRLYALMKYFESKEIIDIELTELKKLLKIEHLYPHYANFKSKVLLPAQKELKKKSDLYFNFKEINSGSKVTAIKFSIHSSRNAEKILSIHDDKPFMESTQDNYINMLMKLTHNEFEEESLSLFLKICSNDIEIFKEAYNLYDEQRKYVQGKKVVFMINTLNQLIS